MWRVNILVYIYEDVCGGGRAKDTLNLFQAITQFGEEGQNA